MHNIIRIVLIIMYSYGAASLSLKSQFMHMMIHHNQVPFMSSIIIAIIVGLSVYLGYKLDPMKYIMKKTI